MLTAYRAFCTMAAMKGRVTECLLAEQRRFIVWVPVCLALGIAWYFSLSYEPVALPGVWVPLAVILSGWVLMWRGWLNVWCRLSGGVCASVAAGFMAAWSAGHAHTPMPELPRRATEITAVVRHVSDMQRDGHYIRSVELAEARFDTFYDDGMPPLQRIIRLKLREDDPVVLAAGDQVRVKALLLPPPFPSFPGGRDMQREFWFADVAGTGRALRQTERLGHSSVSLLHEGEAIQVLRVAWSARIRAALPGSAGAVAATLLVGESGSIPSVVREQFAAAGLAHILSVAGLHLGLVMMVLFWLSRFALVLWERAALYWPCKAIAACIALAGGGAYAVITGLHVPVMRSLIMASVAVAGLCLGRRVMSMRGLALAAAILLVWHPEFLLTAAFQMSFMAVMALIAGYEVLGPELSAYRARYVSNNLARIGHRLAGHGMALCITSLLAGLSALPVVMAHFGEIQPYFLIANLIVVPLMAVWIMPWGLVTFVLLPFHLEGLTLVPMGWGIKLTMLIARVVASWPAAHLTFPGMPVRGLCLVLLGLCWLCLWRQRWRLLGCLPLCVGLLSSLFVAKPDILISPDGGMVGVRSGSALWLGGQAHDAAWVSRAWRQQLAVSAVDSFPQQGEGAGGRLICGEDSGPGVCVLMAHDKAILIDLRSAANSAQLTAAACAGMDVVISAAPLRGNCPDVPVRLDRFTAWWQGAQTIFIGSHTLRVRSGRDAQGKRPWVMAPGGHGLPDLPLAPSE